MKYNILLLIANHTSNKIKYNITLNNLFHISEFVTDIVIIDTNNENYSELLYEDLKGNKKIKEHLFIDNDQYFDFGKWIYYLNKTNINNYDYILFLNDSIILTPDICNYFNYIDNVMTDDVTLYAYNDSSQIKYHYQSYLFLLKKNIINLFIDFFNNRKNLIKDLNTLVINIELCMCEIHNNHSVFLKIGNEYNLSKNLYWENEDLYKYLLNKNIFAIIKIKKIYDIQKEYKITIYGHSINNFDYNFYKEYYEFNNMTDDELLDHFINYGQYEGRKHNKIFNVLLPDYYRTKLNNMSLLYFFDVPDDFDVYYYKKNNSDITHLSILETIFHYISDGYYEGRVYNKINSKNEYLNNYYIKIVNKLEDCNKNIPNDFNLYSSILLNGYLDKYYYLGLLKENIKNNNNLYKKDVFQEKIVNFDIENYKKMNNINHLDNLHIIQHYIDNIDNNTEKIYKLPSDFDYVEYKKNYKDLSKLNNKDLEEHYLLYGLKENRLYKLPSDFDPKVYKSLYNDLSILNDDELKRHYMNNGAYEKRIYKLPPDFDVNMYKNIYDDLKDFNSNELKIHYVNHGINEKRIYKVPPDFDFNMYKNIYADLKDLNKDELLNHYIKVGISENRIYKLPDDFNPSIYKKIYSDLSGFTEENLKNHYLFNGINEKRIYKLPDDFNCKEYRDLYPELKNLTDENLLEHYFIYGLRENKIYKLDDFNSDTYKKIYKDLNVLSANELKIHYVNNGIKEKRIYKIPYDFNCHMYKKIYGDIENLNDIELEEHYLFTGISEGRIYKLPDDFDHTLFKNIYPELSSLNNTQLEEYYLNNGIKENKIYKIPENFDKIIYKKIYPDLNHLNNEQLVNHYLYNGMREGRLYKLPNDFNPIIYKGINNDLKELNETELKEHYLYNGINEKRKYK
jgi:hypothetical protein